MQSRVTLLKAFFVALCLAVLIVPTAIFAQTFTQSRFQTAPSPFGIKTADVNKDGNLDLILISRTAGKCSDDLVIHLGHGKGSFGPALTFDSGICWQGGSVSEFEVTDVNKDGKPDLVYAGGDSLGIRLGNGDGSFQLPKLFPAIVRDNSDRLNSLGVADFNRDGNKDFIVSSAENIEIFYGNGDGTVQSPKLFHVADTANGVRVSDTEAGDFDKDGFADFTFFSYDVTRDFGGTLYAWFGDATGDFADHRVVDTDAPNFYSVKVRDLNKDGKEDIAGTFYNGVFETDPTVGPFTYTSNGDRTFTRNFYGTSGATDGLTFGDFNGDAVLDLATTLRCSTDVDTGCEFGGDPRQDGVLIYPRSVDGTFGQPQKIAITASGDGTNPNDLVSGDFNKDGSPDLAVTLNGTNEVAVLLSRGAAAGCSPDALSNDGILVCSPEDGATVDTTFAVEAYAKITGTIYRFELWANGTKILTVRDSGTMNTSVTLAPGSYQLDFVARNTAGNRIVQTINVVVGSGSTCAAPATNGIVVCSPPDGATVSTTFQVEAYAKVSGTIYRFELWANGTKVVTVRDSGTMNTQVTLPAGSYRLDFVARNAAGDSKVTKTIHVSVR